MADKEKELNSENTETEEAQEEIETEAEKKEEKTADELLKIIGEQFLDFAQEHKEDFKTKTLSEVFLQFLNTLAYQNKSLKEEVEKVLGREINFDDIKFLYLEAGYTLYEDLTKKILSKVKEEKVLDEILKLFSQKIDNVVARNLNLYDEKVFSAIKKDKKLDYFQHLIQEKFKAGEISKEELKKIKEVKVSNGDLLKALEKDNVFNETELKFLKGEIEKKSLPKESKEKLDDLINILISAEYSNTLSSMKEKLETIDLQLSKIVDFNKPLSAILSDYTLNIVDIVEKIGIDDSVKDAIETCLSKKDKKEIKNCLEKVLNKNASNPDFQQLFVLAVYEKEPKLAEILKNLLLEKPLSEEEKTYLFDLLYKDYPQLVINFVKNLASLSEEELKKYKDLIQNILDPSKDKIVFPNGLELNVKKDIILPEIKDLNDLLDAKPYVSIDIEGDQVLSFLSNDYFRNLYFVEFLGNYYSTFSKQKVKLKDGKEIEAYIVDQGDSIEAFESPYFNYEFEPKPIASFKKEDIAEIQQIEPYKLNLKSPRDISALILGAFETIKPLPEIDSVGTSFFQGEKVDEKEIVNLAQGENNLLDNKLDSESKDINSENPDNLDNLKKNYLEYKQFLEEWKEMNGENALEFEKGNIIQLKGVSLKYPGLKNNWYYAEIVDIDKNNGKFSVKLIGGGLVPLKEEGIVISLPLNKEWLKELKLKTGNYVYKFRKLEKESELVEYINNLNLKTEFDQHKVLLNKWKGLELREGKLFKDGKEINYIGRNKDNSLNNNESIGQKPITDFFDVFRIQLDNGNVILTHPYDKNFRKKIDLNTFLAIIMDNELEPWSDEEFRAIEQNSTVKPSYQGQKFHFMSIGNIIEAFKGVKNNFKHFLSEEDEFRAAIAYEKIAGKLPNWWILGELKVEATGEKDAKIWKRITNAKSRLERADTGGNHAKVASQIIETEIFKKVKEGKKLSYKEQLKAAGYLLFALERGPGPYFRKLASYEPGMWIKALLGNAHYYKWKNQVDILKEELKNDPGNENLRDKIVMSEIFYMKDVEELPDLYSAKFPTEIEGGMINLFQSSKVQNVKESEETKGNYYTIYDGYRSYILNNRPPNVMGALQAISERVEVTEHYFDYYKVMLMIPLTGYGYNFFGTNLKEGYEKIARTYGVPIALFTFQYQGLEKIMRILDWIIKEKGYKPGGKAQSLTKYLYGVDDPSKVDVFSLNNKTIIANIIKKLEDFWGEYGEEIVNILDYTDPRLLVNLNSENIDSKTKACIEEYFNTKVNDTLEEKFAFDPNRFVTGYAPYFSRGVLNLPKVTFSKLAMISHGGFVGDDKSIAKNIWANLARKLENMKDEADNEAIFRFVLSKYKLWFGGWYESPINKTLLLQALLSNDDDLLEKAIVGVAKEEAGDDFSKKIPPKAETGLNKFKAIFKNGPNSLKSRILILEKLGFSKNDIKANLLALKELGKLNFSLEELENKFEDLENNKEILTTAKYIINNYIPRFELIGKSTEELEWEKMQEGKNKGTNFDEASDFKKAA